MQTRLLGWMRCPYCDGDFRVAAVSQGDDERIERAESVFNRARDIVFTVGHHLKPKALPDIHHAAA